MINQRYNSEIESLLIQFISAFDDGRIYRPIEDSNEQEIILPRWLVGAKTRIFTDIVNQAGNITLPCAIVEPGSISLRKDRIFNKNLQQRVNIANKEYRYSQPVPIDIKLTVNFYTKFFNDFWQMMSNFAAFTNPYIFTSWRTTGELLPFTEEIRCKVTWDGNFNIDYPKTLSEDQIWLIHGTAGFTLEGWLFERPASGHSIITSVKNTLGATGFNVQRITDADSLDYYVKDGWPSITAIIDKNIHLSSKFGEILPIINGKTITIEGRSFFPNQCSGLLIQPIDSSITDLPGLTPVIVDTIKMGKIKGFAITDEYLNLSENIIKFKIPELPENLIYDIFVYNNAGYTSIKMTEGFTIRAIIP